MSESLAPSNLNSKESGAKMPHIITQALNLQQGTLNTISNMCFVPPCVSMSPALQVMSLQVCAELNCFSHEIIWCHPLPAEPFVSAHSETERTNDKLWQCRLCAREKDDFYMCIFSWCLFCCKWIYVLTPHYFVCMYSVYQIILFK